jgi:hypothetical protein
MAQARDYFLPSGTVPDQKTHDSVKPIGCQNGKLERIEPSWVAPVAPGHNRL